MSASHIDSIHESIEVPSTREETFRAFWEGLGRWWPLAYTFFEDQYASAFLEPRVGGRWFERSMDGHELSWGSVRAFEPGHRIVLSFGVSPDRKPETPESSSEVEVRFTSVGRDRSRVDVVHADFERHGEGAARLHDGLASRQGWPLILAELSRYLRVGREAARPREATNGVVVLHPFARM